MRETWGRKSSAAQAARHDEAEVERRASAYIGQMSVLWVSADDEPASTSERGLIETGAIGQLRALSNPDPDPPSATWLGRHSTRAAVRESGLWNVNHVAGPVDNGVLPVLERRVALM